MKKKKLRNSLEIKFGEKQLKPGGEDFDIAVELFLRNRKLKEIRQGTIQWYQLMLNIFKDYLKEKQIDTAPININREAIEDFLLYLREEQSNKPVSVNGKIRALRVFFNFLEHEKIITASPMKEIKLMRDVDPIVPTFTEEQIKSLLVQPNRSTLTGARDLLVMYILLDTGSRITETLSLNRKDIIWQKKLPVALIFRRVKGKRERTAPLSPKVQSLLKEYLGILDKALPDVNFLFFSLDGGIIKTRSMQDRIKEYGKMASIKGVRVSPHTFRHSFAKMWIMADGDLITLQEILGHSDLEMVKKYARMFSPDIEVKHLRFSPVIRHDL